MNSSDCREEQSSGQTGISQPLFFACEYASGDEDVVS